MSQKFDKKKDGIIFHAPIPEALEENLTTTKSIAIQEEVRLDPMSDKNLKRQLKLEFDSLLSSEPKKTNE